MQVELNAIYDWAKQMNMEFNDDKFQLMRYGKNQMLKNETHYYAPNGNEIQESNIVKDLGVWTQSDGLFEHHIAKTVQKASQMIGWVLRTFKSRDKETMKTLYKSLILSKLDYCSGPFINYVVINLDFFYPPPPCRRT